MKPTTVAAAVASGASVIHRGHNRAYAPGDVAYFIVAEPEPGLGGDVGAWCRPVVWRDGEGWIPAENTGAAPWYRPGRHVGLPATELVTILDRCGAIARRR